MGDTVDLGQVGTPTKAPAPALLSTLAKAGYVPVIACIGAANDGKLFNVNADTLAGSLAARLEAKRLVIAGTTAGVLDEAGATDPGARPRASRSWCRPVPANAGMVAKLTACQAALKGGAGSVVDR